MTAQGSSTDPETGDVVDAIDALVEQVEKAIAAANPLSQRAVALVSLVRFAERAKRFVLAQRGGELPFRLMAEILEMRDLARIEQGRINELLRQSIPKPVNVDVLHVYKIHLAQIEQLAMMSMGYVGSDKEASDEADWWAHRGGALIMETIALAPQMLALPAEPGEV